MRNPNKITLIVFSIITVFIFCFTPFVLPIYYKLVQVPPGMHAPQITFEVQNLWLDRWNIAYIIILILINRSFAWRRFVPMLVLIVSALAWVLNTDNIAYQVHFFVVSCLSIMVLKTFSRPKFTLPLLFWMCVLSECVQAFMPHRVCEIRDILFDFGVVLFGVAYWLITLTRKEQKGLPDSMKRRPNSLG